MFVYAIKILYPPLAAKLQVKFLKTEPIVN